MRVKAKKSKDRRRVRLYSGRDEMKKFRGRMMHHAGLREGKFSPISFTASATWKQ